jgi:hypothetical protein
MNFVRNNRYKNNNIIKNKVLNKIRMRNKLIANKIQESKAFSYHVNNNKVKFLILMACNCDSLIKLNAIKQNIQFLKYKCTKLVIINSIGLPFNEEVQNHCIINDIDYYEIPNEGTCDFGKWNYLLELLKPNPSEYKFTVFINDSIIITHPIKYYLNVAAEKSVELFGYNDSTQNNYHYQSYLFTIRSNCLKKFINMYNSKRHLVYNASNVVEQYELKMLQHFSKKDCLLKLGNHNYQKNIFFTNDSLYSKLQKTKLLPFIKIKRVNN